MKWERADVPPVETPAGAQLKLSLAGGVDQVGVQPDLQKAPWYAVDLTEESPTATAHAWGRHDTCIPGVAGRERETRGPDRKKVVWPVASHACGVGQLCLENQHEYQRSLDHLLVKLTVTIHTQSLSFPTTNTG